ncbi:MAG: penicillin acylase family protein [Desulfobacter sp.]|nr:MAG: penicillin acylase family protein [Desulfobacter sp.]
MKRITVLLKPIGLIVLVLAIAAAGGAWLYLDRRKPVIQGELITPKVNQAVRIVRDQWGVPHIQARSGEDAYFALGFATAQDRLFQMELQRRLARGELAEILGPKLVDVDKKFRTLLLRRTAETYLAHSQNINPRALAFLDRFLAGINHFIDTAPLPVEFTLLGTRPRHFTRLDTVSMMGYVAYSFADGIKRDSLHTILASRLTQRDLDLVFPDYTQDNRVTVMEPEGVPRDGLAAASAPLSPPGPAAGAGPFEGFTPAFQALEEKALGISPPFTGSNSWVLAPSRSKNGHALLANDPHIGIANPGVWYEAHLSYPGYDNYGYHLPLLPFPMLAHNSTKAWAITMFENDDLDLYAETFAAGDPGRVQFKGQWAEVETLEETIKVKGGADVPLTIRITPHGPVISDFLPGYTGRPVSLSWVYHKMENPILDVAFDMGRAKTMAEFRSALSRLAAPGLNISYIDAGGNIGWWAAGRLPVRPAHMTGKEIHDGGSGRDEWAGFLPFEQNPQMENPENGMIITANNLSTMAPVGTGGILTGYFRPSDRAARIYQRLSRQEKWDMDGLKQIQTDTLLHSGRSMADAAIKVLELKKKEFSGPQALALEALQEWDGFMETDSRGGSVFQFTLYHILKQALEPAMGTENFTAYLNQVDHWNFLKQFFRTRQTIAGTSGLAGSTYEEIVLAGFKNGVNELVEKYGNTPDQWNWGAIHKIEFVHAIGKKKPMNLLFNIGPFPSPGEFTSINKLKSKVGRHDYRVSSLPSTRRLIDCNDPDNTWSILPTGNSGSPLSPFYDDQAQMFITGQYRKILTDRDRLARDHAGVLAIRPH